MNVACQVSKGCNNAFPVGQHTPIGLALPRDDAANTDGMPCAGLAGLAGTPLDDVCFVCFVRLLQATWSLPHALAGLPALQDLTLNLRFQDRLSDYIDDYREMGGPQLSSLVALTRLELCLDPILPGPGQQTFLRIVECRECYMLPVFHWLLFCTCALSLQQQCGKGGFSVQPHTCWSGRHQYMWKRENGIQSLGCM